MPTKPQKQLIRKLLKSISNKRARIVIEHILKHGHITTEELEKKYGYNHPPRAARDVREAGIPLETFRVSSSDKRSIAAYKFGDLTQIREGRLQGRRTFPKKFKDELLTNSEGNALSAPAGLKRDICKLIIAYLIRSLAIRKKQN